MKAWALVVFTIVACWEISGVWWPSGAWFYAYSALFSLVIMEVIIRASVANWLRSMIIGCEVAAIITNLGASAYYQDLVGAALFYDRYEVYMYALAAIELGALAVYPFTGAGHAGLNRRTMAVIRSIRAYFGYRMGSSSLGVCKAEVAK